MDLGLILSERLSAAAARLAHDEIDALLVTPGSALHYLTGYDALALERLTCLVVLPDDSAPSLVVPELERPAAFAAGLPELGIEVLAWGETQDPIAAVVGLLPERGTVALDDQMPARHVLALRDCAPGLNQILGSALVDDLRMRKEPFEVDALRSAGRAIDSVHARMGEWLRPGRSEREVGRDIAEAIVAAGHRRVDFVIVAGGPNAASPHHEVSDRILEAGDVVVVDIGGTTPEGYCSDCTRTYVLGSPDPEFASAYAQLEIAQQAAFEAVGVGVPAQEVDRAARTVLSDAGLGEYFVHRTGHGIGMSTHEEPYIVEGNERPLEQGMAFSIEPGFYFEGRWGARLEDIVVLTATGAERVNHQPRGLVIL